LKLFIAIEVRNFKLQKTAQGQGIPDS